jgi:hypothetical protein
MKVSHFIDLEVICQQNCKTFENCNCKKWGLGDNVDWSNLDDKNVYDNNIKKQASTNVENLYINCWELNLT